MNSRHEELLMTIDRLGIVKIKHLLSIHNLSSYRNACRVVNQLSEYTHQIYYEKEKVIYLNKAGREYIGSDKEVTKSMQIGHYLLRNDVYIHFDCPYDWKNEYTLEVEEAPSRKVDGIIFGDQMKVNNKKKVVADALFTRNGYTHIIEIDNQLNMTDNRKKVQSYAEIIPLVRKNFESTPIIYFFTTTEARKTKLSAWLRERSLRAEVKLYDEIK
ncbi:hypothetical protein FZC79_10555 [Rossellomorea vietnamensis]|uniref:Replication-relaxation n=1 Tax=Rossellomorea vietnamensis TaxID=218284 RepID=A0A5D4KFF1_9BACI|nr:hypothetical protein [Rossellomorea vietnamensis]TYR75599.1 hypothetical protein FZC79_10555 [Rossellomorea vietnamensis]